MKAIIHDGLQQSVIVTITSMVSCACLSALSAPHKSGL